jgi:predicted RNase H-like HicB family nuclease
MRYTVLLEPEEGGGFAVSVPALPGCISQGETREEALANVREAISLYIDDCREAETHHRRCRPDREGVRTAPTLASRSTGSVGYPGIANVW